MNFNYSSQFNSMISSYLNNINRSSSSIREVFKSINGTLRRSGIEIEQKLKIKYHCGIVWLNGSYKKPNESVQDNKINATVELSVIMVYFGGGSVACITVA